MKEITKVALEQNYTVKKYYERRGIPGVISWWSEIKVEEVPGKIHLNIHTTENYDSVTINGEVIYKKPKTV